MRLCVLVVVMLLTGPASLLGEEAVPIKRSLAEDVARYVHRWQDGKYVSISTKDFQKHDVTAVIRAARTYASDPDPPVRSEAIVLEFRVAVDSGRLPVIHATVEYLAGVIRADAEQKDVSVAAKLLGRLNRKHFSDKARELLNARMDETKPTVNLVRLAGVAQLEDQRDELLLLSEHGKGGLRRSADLALARMGDQPAIDEVMQRYFVNEDVTGRLLQDAKNLQYIRSPEAVAELIRELNSNVVYPATIDTDPIPHAELAVTYLHKMLDGFPVQEDSYSSVTKEQLQIARDWVAAQESLKILK